MNNIETEKRIDELATEILDLSRSSLSVSLHFINAALGMLKTVKSKGSISVDGANIFYDPIFILKKYKSDKNIISRHYLHMLLHCVFSHAFIDCSIVNKDYWDLACDIAVEAIICELNLECTYVSVQVEQGKEIGKIKKDVKNLTAEKIYRYFLDGNVPEKHVEQLKKWFSADDHSIWYAEKDTLRLSDKSDDDQVGDGIGNRCENDSIDESNSGDSSDSLNKDSCEENDVNENINNSPNDNGCEEGDIDDTVSDDISDSYESDNINESNSSDSSCNSLKNDSCEDDDIEESLMSDEKSNACESGGGNDDGSNYESGEIGSDGASGNITGADRYESSDIQSLSPTEMKGLWKDISERMQMELESFAKQHGDKSGSLMQNLYEINREKYNYTAFLKKFTVMGETMKINDDEFDNIFYTYGLSLYSDMPLIEPLEYKDVRRIRELVIAIDTSGSVSGSLVQAFLRKTYNILKSEESFFKKINLHIIQCDAKIQEDIKITNQQEFDEYIKCMSLRGFGGTDFRPVFRYVDELINKHEFVNLKGLIYFTDGYGDFPMQKPSYKTAFIFIDDEYNNYNIPAWAIKLTLKSNEI